MENNKVFYLLLFICFYSFSQEKKIQGVVFDAKNNPLFNVSVQLIEKKTNNTVSYTTTDEKGFFSLNIENFQINKYHIKIRHLGFKPYKKDIDTFTLEDLKITLEEQTIQLTEIKIKSNYKEFEIKKDTIVFDFKKIRDSTETTLKDLVEKLPGLQIDKNKKLSFQGKKIDKVLIDGEDFFGKKHEMATENLPSDAVKGIEIIENFKEFESVEEEKGGKIVLNVSLNRDYKNKIVGNIESNHGIIKKYQMHSNIFKFIKKGNIALISEVNNTGEPAINMIDYIEMQGGIGNFVDNFEEGESGVYEIDHSKLPRFVFANSNVDKRDVVFNSLNYTHKFSDRIKLNGYVTFDRTKQTEEQTMNKKFINNLLPNTVENNSNFSKSFLGNSFLNFIYKKNKNESIRYQLKINPFKNNEILTIENINSQSNNFENKINDNDFTFGQSLMYQKKFSKHWRLKSTLINDYKTTTRDYLITSNKAFLSLVFNNNDFSVLQESNSKLNSINLNSDLYYTVSKKITLDFSFNYSLSSVSLKREIANRNNFLIDVKRKQKTLSGKFGVFYKYSRKFKINTKIKYSFTRLSVNGLYKKYYWLLPNVVIDYKLNRNNRFSFSYSKTKKNLSIYYMQNGDQLINYQTILLRGGNFYKPIEENNFSASLNKFNATNNSLLSFSASYYNTKNQIGYNSFYKDNFIENRMIRTPEKGVNFMLYYSKKIKWVPFSVKSKFSFNKSTSENTFNNLLNKRLLNRYISEVGFLSKFKKSPLQTKLKIDYSLTQSTNSFNALNYKSSIVSVRQSFRGKVKKRLIWNAGSNFKLIKTRSISRSILAINFLFRYRLLNKKGSIFFKGSNIFNTRRNQFVSQNITEAYSQLTMFENLKGYILVGGKFNF